MKRLILILALALPSWGALSVANVNGVASNTDPNAYVSFTLTASTGDLIHVATTYYNNFGNTVTVTDSASNSYSSPLGRISNGNDFHEDFYAYNVTGGSPLTIKVNLSGSAGQTNFVSAVGFDVSGAATSSTPLDQYNIDATGSSLPITSSSFSTSVANEIIICSVSSYYNNVITSGTIGGTSESVPTNGNQNNGSLRSNLWAFSRIVSSTQSSITAATNNGSGTYQGSIICTTYEQSAAAAKACTMTLLGTGPC
jgi:hypothetical protein